MSALLDSYSRYRRILDDLTQTLVDGLLPEELAAAAGALGVSSAPDDPGTLRALLDHALHRRANATAASAVERHRAALTAAPGWETALVLQALARAPYRLLHITRCQPGQSLLTMRDALRSETLEVTDVQLSATAQAGMTLGGRLLILPELCMTTGALLPASKASIERLEALLARGALPATAASARALSPWEAEQVGARILTCLLDSHPTPARRRGERR